MLADNKIRDKTITALKLKESELSFEGIQILCIGDYIQSLVLMKSSE